MSSENGSSGLPTQGHLAAEDETAVKHEAVDTPLTDSFMAEVERVIDGTAPPAQSDRAFQARMQALPCAVSLAGIGSPREHVEHIADAMTGWLLDGPAAHRHGDAVTYIGDPPFIKPDRVRPSKVELRTWPAGDLTALFADVSAVMGERSIEWCGPRDKSPLNVSVIEENPESIPGPATETDVEVPDHTQRAAAQAVDTFMRLVDLHGWSHAFRLIRERHGQGRLATAAQALAHFVL